MSKPQLTYRIVVSSFVLCNGQSLPPALTRVSTLTWGYLHQVSGRGFWSKLIDLSNDIVLRKGELMFDAIEVLVKVLELNERVGDRTVLLQ